MRTTIELPDELFREAKTRAVHEGMSLKQLIIQCVRSGLGKHSVVCTATPRRPAPPVAIARIPGRPLSPVQTNEELTALLEDEEVLAAHDAGTSAPA
jgi:hypothetical protein